MEGNRPRQTPADQRETTFIDLKASPATDAPRRPTADSQRRTAPQTQHRAPAPKRPGRKKKRKTGLIVALCCILCVILLAAAGTLFVLFSEPEDDGLILNNVYAAGVNLGGKSPESAKQVLHEASTIWSLPELMWIKNNEPENWAKVNNTFKMEAKFISNVEPDDAAAVLNTIDVDHSLFVLVSKSGTKHETLKNE